MEDFIPCFIAVLPEEKQIEAARAAVEENPANAPSIPAGAELLPMPTEVPQADGGNKMVVEVPQAYRLALITSKYWGAAGVNLGVSFLDTQDTSLKSRILEHMNAWGEFGNVVFRESSRGEVRISRTPGGGYWSYLGTDVLQIASGQPTMNLDSFSLNTPESEYRRVVRHEVGHTLGFPHEHMRPELVSLIDPQKAIEYFRRTQGWSASTTQQQVLTPLSNEAIKNRTDPDQVSIMCYQLPGSITRSGAPIPGGLDIDPLDKSLVAKLFPKAVVPPTGATGTITLAVDWAGKKVVIAGVS